MNRLYSPPDKLNCRSARHHVRAVHGAGRVFLPSLFLAGAVFLIPQALPQAGRRMKHEGYS